MSVLVNIRIPEDLKDEFQLICRKNHTYMTTEIIRFLKDFIRQDVSSKSRLQKDLRSLERTTSQEKSLSSWGGLIQDPVTKTWMSKEEYYGDR